jgi:hypothetical protein
MPQPCTICTNPQRSAIDRALVEATPKRRVASQYGLTEAAVRRHVAAHLPSTLALAHQAGEVQRSGDLWEDAALLQEEAVALVAAAKRSGSISQGTQALQCAQRGIALMATLRAQINELDGPHRRYVIRWAGQAIPPAICPHCNKGIPRLDERQADGELQARAALPPVIDAEVVESRGSHLSAD